MYSVAKVSILLVGIEVWTDRNHVPINGNIGETLFSFISFMKQRAKEVVRFDNAQFISLVCFPFVT